MVSVANGARATHEREEMWDVGRESTIAAARPRAARLESLVERRQHAQVGVAHDGEARPAARRGGERAARQRDEGLVIMRRLLFVVKRRHILVSRVLSIT